MTPVTLRPPRLATWFVRRVLRRDPAGRAILGDLHEDFVRIHRERGPASARRWYWREASGLGISRLCGLAFRRLTGALSSPGLLLRGVIEDAGYALRSVRRNPAFAIFTAAMIGLGVGAATAVYSVLEPLVLAPLPFREPGELVWIANDAAEGDNSLYAVTSRTANLHDFRERAGSFQGITGFNAFSRERAYTLAGSGEPERLVGVGVAHDFLDVLGVELLRGRGFTREEGRHGGPPAVILSHGLWQRRFGGDPQIVGRAVTLNDVARTVVAVLPPTFDFSSIFDPGTEVDVLLPFPVLPAGAGGFQGNILFMIGRLSPGVSPAAAQAELDAILVGLREAQPDRWGLAAVLTPLQAHIAGPFRGVLLLLAAAAGTLLLIVCVNVSNLLLARSPKRRAEVAVRKAMGASPARLVRQFLLEATGIALVGAALGAGLAWGAIRVVAATAGIDMPMLDRVAVDGSALLVAGAVAVLTGLAAGVAPALQVAECAEATALRSTAPGSGQSRGAWQIREGLVVAQVALACVLLVTGGLLVRSFVAVLETDLGFDPTNVVAWQLSPGKDFESIEERSDFHAALVERVQRARGVERAGLVDALPLGGTRTWTFSVVGAPDEEDTDQQVYPHVVDPGYLPTLRIRLVAGRNFTDRDTGNSPKVVMINEAGARRVFGGEDPLGRELHFWTEWDWEVVGIVKDVRHLSPEMGPGIEVYFPVAQMPDFRSLSVAVRSSLPTERLAEVVAGALREVDPSLPTREFWTLRSTVDRATSARRFTLEILGAYSVAALFLAGLGIYGLLAQSVAERRAEIAIRMALGASAVDIGRSVLGRMLRLSMTGVAVGAVLAFLAARLLSSLLFGVGPTDPVTFGTMALVLLVVTAVAGALPAVRAARVKAMGAIRPD